MATMVRCVTSSGIAPHNYLTNSETDVSQGMESGRQWYGRILFGIMNLVALTVAIVLPVGHASQNSLLHSYPLVAILPSTIIFGCIPIVSAVFTIRWFRRRARERRTLASDTPATLPGEAGLRGVVAPYVQSRRRGRHSARRVGH